MTKPMPRNVLLLCALSLANGGCRPAQPPTPITQVLRPDTTVRISDAPDTLQVPETLLSDRSTLTLTRLSILHTYLRAFVETNAVLPQRLGEIRMISPEGYERASVDAWGTPIQYTGDEVKYELRSAGSDQSLGTSDDIILAGVKERPEPCYIVRGNARRINYTPPC